MKFTPPGYQYSRLWGGRVRTKVPLVSWRRRRSEDAPARATVVADWAGCPACGCRLRRPLFNVGEYDYVACPACGLAHLDPPPTEQQARGVFDDTYFSGGVEGGYDDYVADELLHRENAWLRLALLRTLNVAPPGRMLDVGCAHGFFLDEARADGWSVEGADVSPTAAAYASTRLRLDVAADVADAAQDGPYDLVTLFQVLEHVAAPTKLLEQARDSLGPDGTVVIETWDRGSIIPRVMRSHWQVVAPPSVVWLWDRNSLALLLAAAGLRITSIHRTTKLVSLRFVTSLLERERGPLGGISRLVDDIPWRDRSLRYQFRDLITISAQRADRA